MKRKRVEVKQTGEKGIVIKVIGNCIWVAMDDGRELSGAKRYFRVLEKTQ